MGSEEMEIKKIQQFLENFLPRSQNKKLLAQINAAYQESSDPSEQALQHRTGRHHRHAAKDNRQTTEFLSHTAEEQEQNLP